MTKKATAAMQAAELRRRLRKLLHDQLDTVLNGMTTEDGKDISVCDSMLLRAMQGYGFDVQVSSRHPSDPKAMPAETVQAGPALGLVRDEPQPESGA